MHLTPMLNIYTVQIADEIKYMSTTSRNCSDLLTVVVIRWHCSLKLWALVKAKGRFRTGN